MSDNSNKKSGGRYTKKKYPPPIFIGSKVPEDWTTLPVSNKGAVPLAQLDVQRMVFTCPEGKQIPNEDGKYYMNKCFYIFRDGTRGPVVFYPAVKKGKGNYEFRQVLAYGVKPDNIDKDGNIRKDKYGREKDVRGYNVTFRWHDPEDSDDIELAEQDVEKCNQLTNDWAGVVASNLSKFLPSYAAKNRKATAKKLIKGDKIKTIMWRRTMTKDENGELVDLDPKEYGAWQLRSSLIYWPNKGEMDTVFVPPAELSNDPLDNIWSYGFFAYPKLVLQGLYSNGIQVSFMVKVYASTVWPAPRRETLSGRASAEDMPSAPMSSDDAQKLIKSNSRERRQAVKESKNTSEENSHIKMKGSKRTIINEEESESEDSESEDGDIGDPAYAKDSEEESDDESTRKPKSKKGRKPPPESESESEEDEEPRHKKSGRKGKRRH